MNPAGLRGVYIFNQQGGDTAVKPELPLVVRSLPASSMKVFAYLVADMSARNGEYPL